jgi:NAD(P)-dependent dehydrogenase (short-subunit alcohol dehydrogenase family)
MCRFSPSLPLLIRKCNDEFPYIMSKGAVNHLTMMLAADFATRNIRVRVNSIAPGVFPSEINQFNGDIATAEEADRAAGTLLPLPSRRAGK